MNTIWSGCIQGTNTLYYSRKLRFDEHPAWEDETLPGEFTAVAVRA